MTPVIPEFLTGLHRWILWREVKRRGQKPTKLPYSYQGVSEVRSITDPNNWSSYTNVTEALARTPGAWDGPGIVLGDLGNGEVLIGLDLDSCLLGGRIQEWAKPYLELLPTYTEVSPSGGGLKLFFRGQAADLAAVRRMFFIDDNKNGRKVTYGTSDDGHPPAAEIYLGFRYFTVTGDQWEDVAEVALITNDTLAKLATLFGPKDHLSSSFDAIEDVTAPDSETLKLKLSDAINNRPFLDARWHGSKTGLSDQSRSGYDMSLGSMLKGVGFSYGEMRAALIANQNGAGQEKAAAGDERYFERIWQNSPVKARQPLEPPPFHDDPGYWASVEADASMSEHDWETLERREGGHSEPSSPEAKARAGSALWAITEPWDVIAIPPRPWVARGYLMRRAVTVISGPGSAGKSSLMVAWATALVIGSAFHRMKPVEKMRVATYNVEDDGEEQKRRFSAMLAKLGITQDSWERRLAILGPTTVGTLLQMAKDGTILVNTPVMDRLEAFVEEFRPDVLMLDPFVELHGAEENDNTMIRAVMAKFRAMAVAYDMAVVLLHHARKGSGSPGDPDTMRGASSIVGAARVALTCNVMTDEEAKSFQVPDHERRDYFRLDGAKSNYAKLEEAEWFHRDEIELPNGDGVAVAWPWRPPSPFKDTTSSGINDALTRIAAGPEPGVLYAASRQGGAGNWAGDVLIKTLGIADRQAKQMLDVWLKTGLIYEEEYYNPALRKSRKGVRVNEDKRPS